jgi:competence protein ComGC
LKKAFTLIELLLVTIILVGLTAVFVINLQPHPLEAYRESKESLKLFVSYHVHRSKLDQKQHTIVFDPEKGLVTSLIDCPIDISLITNGLVIVDFAEPITFFIDGQLSGGEIKITSLDGNIINILDINPIGIVRYRP